MADQIILMLKIYFNERCLTREIHEIGPTNISGYMVQLPVLLTHHNTTMKS